jgi:hypothetical protein
LTAGRLVGIGHLAIGTWLLARPAAVAAALSRTGDTPPDVRVVRLLGVRSLAQGAAITAAPSARMLTAGGLVDALHALSMIPVAAVSRRNRRAAALSCAVATLAAAAETASCRALSAAE